MRIEPGFIGRPDPILASLATGMHQMYSTNIGGPAHACLDGHLLFIRILMPLEHPIESNTFFRAPDRICLTLLRELSQIIRYFGVYNFLYYGRLNLVGWCLIFVGPRLELVHVTFQRLEF
jgi:hypothetical protein